MDNIDLYMLKAIIDDKQHPRASTIDQGGQSDHEAISEQFGKWRHPSCCCEEQWLTIVYTQPHYL